jgi:hypothetical protein
LSAFNWIIDAKNDCLNITDYEKLWTTLISPFISSSKNLGFHPEGNYSYFINEYRIPLGSVPPPRQTIEPPKNSLGYIDIKKIMEKSLEFKESKDENGLQLVDIISSCFSRAMNGNLKESGWSNLGSLFLKQNPQSVSILTMGNEEKIIPERHKYVINTIESKAKYFLS